MISRPSNTLGEEPLPLKVEPDGVRAEPRKIGHRWLDLIFAGSAMLVSLMSIAIAVHESRTQEKLVEASSWPFLQFATGNGDERNNPVITLVLTNVGSGPALVKSFQVFHRGVWIRDSGELLERCCGQKVTRATSRVAGGVIPLHDSVTFLRLARTSDNEATWNKLNAARFQLSFKACYCSILGDCWTSDLTGLAPEPVAVCQPRRNYEPAGRSE